MKIAILGSMSKPTKPTATGGVEVWTALFLQEAIKRGYKFDLYAVKGSMSIHGKINLIEVSKEGVDTLLNKSEIDLLEDEDKNRDLLFEIFFSRALMLLKKNEKKYDLIINSSGNDLLAINSDIFEKPIINIGHFNPDKPFVKFFKYYKLSANNYYVFPTKKAYFEADNIPQNRKFLIPHGIDLKKIPFEKGNKQNLLWFGRIDPLMNKGVVPAARIASKLKTPLDIYTYIENKKYFQQVVEPKLNRYTNLQTNKPRSKYFKRSKVYILPLGWEEPFGLSVLEALASGTPVVAYAKGAMIEIIKDGITGYLINPSRDDKRGKFIIRKTGINGMVEAVQKIYSLSDQDYKKLQKNCRKFVKENFSLLKMVDGYKEALDRIYKENYGPKLDTAILKNNVKLVTQDFSVLSWMFRILVNTKRINIKTSSPFVKSIIAKDMVSS